MTKHPGGQIVPERLSKHALLILICGSSIVLLSFGIRSSFGLFLQPMTSDLGWGRETFALALALQNLLWGLGQPFAGMLADKWGTRLTLTLGGLLYAAGVYLMSVTSVPWMFHLSAGVLIGLALSATAFGIVLAAVGRAVPVAHRSTCLGIVTAVGSLGQFLLPPIGQAFIATYGWSTALLLMAFGALGMVALAQAVNAQGSGTLGADEQTLRQALGEASKHPSYVLLTAGFFVCGWHVAFISVHLPAYLADAGISTGVAAWCLSLIGLFNVVGSYTAGVLGGRRSKKYLLSFLYAARSVVILAFILLPLTAGSALLFSAAMGLLWLSTVPLTSGLVAQMFGPRYMGTLFGIVFFSHQIGSFLGIWLGGVLYDRFGSYDGIWWASIVLGLVAALIHWPIDERAVLRLRPEPLA